MAAVQVEQDTLDTLGASFEALANGINSLPPAGQPLAQANLDALNQALADGQTALQAHQASATPVDAGTGADAGASTPPADAGAGSAVGSPVNADPGTADTGGAGTPDTGTAGTGAVDPATGTAADPGSSTVDPTTGVDPNATP